MYLYTIAVETACTSNILYHCVIWKGTPWGVSTHFYLSMTTPKYLNRKRESRIFVEGKAIFNLLEVQKIRIFGDNISDKT